MSMAINLRQKISDKLSGLISLYNSGKNDEVLRNIANMSTLEAASPYVRNLHGLVLIRLNRIEKAQEQFEQVLYSNPDNYEAHANMGLIEKKKGNPSRAQMFFEKAIALGPNVAHAYYNLANLQLQNSEYQKSIENYQRAVKLNPRFLEAFHNLGVAHNSDGDPDKAKKSFSSAISLKGDYRLSLEELAKMQRDVGDIEESLATYRKIMGFFPNYAEARVRWLGLVVQLMHISQINYFREYELNGLLEKRLASHPRYQIFMAIFSLICRDQESLTHYLRCYTKLDKRAISPSDKRFCDAFLCLLNNHKKHGVPTGEHPEIFHFGESNCLTIANQILHLNDEKRLVAPRITIGAKAHHFCQKGDNRFKSITRKSLDSIPKNSTVLINFGGIDCRPKEGFIQVASKLKVPVESLIAKTIQGYVGWFDGVNQQNRHFLHFVGVSAPVYRTHLSEELNNMVSNVRVEFNSQLRMVAQKKNFKFIDVHSASSNRQGFSNNKLHIDSVHLDLAIKKIVEEQL